LRETYESFSYTETDCDTERSHDRVNECTGEGDPSVAVGKLEESKSRTETETFEHFCRSGGSARISKRYKRGV